MAVGHWVASIALINQAIGHNVGYLNPLLYREIGPTGVLHAITAGDNGIGGIKGYDAGPGWSPAAGWGSPDLTRLVTWFSKHPDTRAVTATLPRAAAIPVPAEVPIPSNMVAEADTALVTGPWLCLIGSACHGSAQLRRSRLHTRPGPVLAFLHGREVNPRHAP